MFNFIKNLIPHFKKHEELKKENEQLKEKLSKSQHVINKTNAYWKNKLYKKGKQ